VQRVFFPEVNRVTVVVLAAEGFEVYTPAAPRCCGSLQLHTGYEDHARVCARETIAAFGGHDTVIVNSAGCGSGMKDYGELMDAPAFEAKVRDVLEFPGRARGAGDLLRVGRRLQHAPSRGGR
jgi:glycolate oxidase iron-sulfur subunit